MLKSLKAITLSIIFLCSVVFAHHGKDYFVATSYSTPHKGDFLALLSFDYDSRASHHHESENHLAAENDGFSLEPGFLYGLSDKWSLELHTHNLIADGALHTESFALESLIRIFDEKNDHTHFSPPFSIAVLLEYGFGFEETPDDLELQLIMGKDLRLFSLVANLIAQKMMENNEQFQYKVALGINPYLPGSISGTLEFDMGFGENSEIYLTPGIRFSPSAKLDFRIGTSINLHADNSDFIMRSMIIYEF
ncbi:MAG: hypothetical protein V3U16_03500 [Candidatus Neomarinimicrobiota bacterium]